MKTKVISASDKELWRKVWAAIGKQEDLKDQHYKKLKEVEETGRQERERE